MNTNHDGMMLLAALLPIAHRHSLVALKGNPCIRILLYSKCQRHGHQLDAFFNQQEP